MSDLFRFTAPTDGRLTPDMKSAYAEAGVLVLENYLTKDETARMRDATAALVEEFDPETVRTVFSTDDQKHAADTYFRESGDKVRYFFEAGALD
ncbi:MAG: phytanoyl-CoA dioxygenase family protein, partial [Pseudomonadota bacterium]